MKDHLAVLKMFIVDSVKSMSNNVSIDTEMHIQIFIFLLSLHELDLQSWNTCIN